MSKKIIIKTILFLVLLLILILLVDLINSRFSNKKNFENSILSQVPNNETSIFSIDKITFFSSCNANSTINANSSITIENLYQYTDIAIFINNTLENSDFTSENTLKEVYINNISFSEPPFLGVPSLYYQTLNNFSSGNFLADKKITNTATFDITSANVIDYSSTALHNNCANPITLCYVNSNINNDYTISNLESFAYNGTLLKTCNIPAKNLECSISFDIYIVNNLNEKFKCPIYFKIPLFKDNSSILDGSLVFQNNTNFPFFKIS